MVLTDIRLQNYRLYKDSSFELDGGITIVVGPNAAGKSSLIEALLLVANGTSYRGKIGTINYESDWARIDVHTDRNTSRTVKLVCGPDKEKPGFEFIIDTKPYKRLPYAQKQPAVLFEPNNLSLLHNEPQPRREYLDNLASGIDSGYATTLSKYRRTLAQRNTLLKNPNPTKDQLFVWDVRLCELAGEIVRQRLQLTMLINEKLSAVYSKIATKTTELNVSYESPIDTGNYSANLLKKLESELQADLARGFSGSGPHREDFSVTLGKKPVSIAASRGETRTLLLSLKVIELELLEEKSKVRPLLLLDDVFSELDGTRRKALTKFLRKYQTIITTTDADVILKNFSQNCQIIPLNGGANSNNN
jgi:DNA replication and repair protein RecF